VEPDDVVQEVFLTVYKRLGEFRGDSKITTWLYRITQNIIRQRRRSERLQLWFSGTPQEVGAEVAAQDESPVQAIERRQSTERLYQILDGMKENYRTALILFEIEQLSGEEISELIGVRISTLWVWLHRARALFLKRLQALEAREHG
jgi:RNA polymerase sigma-70 factor (ECF subfamily)